MGAMLNQTNIFLIASGAWRVYVLSKKVIERVPTELKSVLFNSFETSEHVRNTKVKNDFRYVP